MSGLPIARRRFCEMEGGIVRLGSGSAARARGRGIPGLVRAHHSGRQLADRPCRHVVRDAAWPVRRAGGAGPDGAFGRDDGRRCAGVARSGAAAAWHRPVGAGDPVRQRAVGAASRRRRSFSPRRRRFCFPSLPISRSIRRWRAAAWSPPSLLRASPGWSSTRSCFFGLPSARSISWPGRSSANPGWCCCRFRSWRGCAAATNGSASSRHNFLQRGER